MKAKTELWQRALARRARQKRVREYNRRYRRRIDFELKVIRIRAIFARVEELCEKLIAS